MKRRTVITGIGVICPLGSTTAEFWENCIEGKSVVAPIPDRWNQYAAYKSGIWSPLPEIAYETRQITRIERMQSDPFTLQAAGAAYEAIDSAGLTTSPKNKKHNTFTIDQIDPIRAGVFMGTGIGGANMFLANHSHQALSGPKGQLLHRIRDLSIDDCEFAQIREVIDRFVHPARFNPFVVSMLMPNAAGASLGIKFSLSGPNSTFAVACAAGTVAIGHAFKAIQSGEVDIALTGGSEYLSDEYGGIFQGFDIAGTLVHDYEDPILANRPFDAGHCGFLFSEGGAAVLVVENLDHAISRDAPIIAEVIGFAQSFDAYSMMSITPETVQIERMLLSALKDAQLSPDDVQYLNSHGTGTEKNDTLECQVIENIFGRNVYVNSTKSLTGHLIGDSGAVEAAVTALSL